MSEERAILAKSETSHHKGYNHLVLGPLDKRFQIFECCDVLTSQGRKYRILDYINHGTYGQVVKAMDEINNCLVAIKISNNDGIYAKTVQNEVVIIYNLAKKFDLEEHCISDFSDWFWLGSSYCAVSRLMHHNALKYCRMRASFSDILTVAKSLLKAMALIHSESIIHADIKPENILLARHEDTQILSAKLADFGSSRFCHRSITEESPAIKKYESHYEQSRFYRAPEVVLGLETDTAIDIWSFGCVLYEMLMGIPLFYATDCYDLLSKMIELMGLPSQTYINESSECNTYFKKHPPETEFTLLTKQDYYSKFQKPIPRPLSPPIDYTTVWTKLQNECTLLFDEKLFKTNAAKETASIKILEILQSVFQWESWRRPTAAHLLTHPLFKDI